MAARIDEQVETGTVIGGRYRVEHLLGEGGFASVYLARHVELDTPVAIKRMHPQHLTRDDLQNRFRAEARTAATLESRHTVRVRDFGFDDEGAPYMVMDLVRGPTLEQVLSARGSLDDDVVAAMALGVLAALAEAADHGVIHRDIKPANIFLAEQRALGNVIAKVSDFGIAKLVHAEANTATRTADGVMCTPQYAAPEMLRREAVAASDLYALGHVMAELLDGAAPYAGDNPIVSAAMHLGPDPVPLGPRASASLLRPIIARAVLKDPQARFGNAGEMADAIRRVYADVGRTITVDLETGMLAGATEILAAVPRPTEQLRTAINTPSIVAPPHATRNPLPHAARNPPLHPAGNPPPHAHEPAGNAEPGRPVRDDVETSPFPARRSAAAAGGLSPAPAAAAPSASREPAHWGGDALDDRAADRTRQRRLVGAAVAVGLALLVALVALASAIRGPSADGPAAEVDLPAPSVAAAPAPIAGGPAAVAAGAAGVAAEPGAAAEPSVAANEGAANEGAVAAATVASTAQALALVTETPPVSDAGHVDEAEPPRTPPAAAETEPADEEPPRRSNSDRAAAASPGSDRGAEPSRPQRDQPRATPADEPEPSPQRTAPSPPPTYELVADPPEAATPPDSEPSAEPARTIRMRAPLQLDDE